MAKYKLRQSSRNFEFGFDTLGNLVSNDSAIGTKNGATVQCRQTWLGGHFTLRFTFTATPVTLVKNGTSTGGGGTKIFTFPAGLVTPTGASSNLTIAAAGDKSFLASLGSAAAGTDGTLTSTEISFAPSTAATTSSGAGTCKMKSTVTIPTPGLHLDGTSSAVEIYLNSCLNADATGVEALTYSGTATINGWHHGDN